MANRETHVLNPAWPGLVALCGRRVADVSPVCASAPESGPLNYRAGRLSDTLTVARAGSKTSNCSATTCASLRAAPLPAPADQWPSP